ncbi:riboflavin kinase, partial [Jaminaea rosea]
TSSAHQTQPPASLQAPSDRATRPSIVGEDSGPTPPFPIYLAGTVQRGFGRGGKDLGCPTANLPSKLLQPAVDEHKGSGSAAEQPSLSPIDTRVHPMVMSLGWNPFYANKTKTAEVHIMHPFKRDFYGLQIQVIVLGYIRPEYNYVDVEALKNDIETDKQVANRSLERATYSSFASDSF